MVYIIHFDRPYKHAKHYTGFHDESKGDLQARLDEHMNGRGARLMDVIICEGIGFTVGAILKGNRKEERRIKNEAHPERYCKVCQSQKRKRLKCSGALPTV